MLPATSATAPGRRSMSDRSTTSGVAPICSATSRSVAPSRSTANTVAPSAANRPAMARPMPLAAPVTRAVRPSIGLLGSADTVVIPAA